ncbi:MAG TPA: penicillin-binding protein 1C [Vicinamibacterales bacterium]|nr:penicillin-binding protein 1C [Vicinamibacterales bacterium]
MGSWVPRFGVPRFKVPGFTIRRVVAAGVCLAVAAAWLRLGPIDPILLNLSEATSTVVIDRRGVPLYEALSGDGTRNVRLEAAALPAMLVAATVAAEDRRFRAHPGLDPLAMLRAVRHNVIEGRIVEGGSTITQQVAKLLISRREPRRSRGWSAKLREAVLALRLEHRFDKHEILAMYLNLAAYGNQIVGAVRASRAYFGVEPRMLTPAQAAFLAGLPQRPSSFNPYRNRDLAISRQRVVLRRMEAAGALAPEHAREALHETLTFTSAGPPFLAPHFVEMVLSAAGPDRPARIETTIDARLQDDIAGIIRSHRPVLDRHGAANVAVVVLDNLRGEWLAWEGSGDYLGARGGTINGPLVPRQPGSALKPFTYALAFEEGRSPATALPDIASHFPTAEPGVLYSPRNYDGRYRGPLLARRALAGSENVPAVALASELGVPRLQRFLARAGLTTLERTAAHYGLGLTLGNAEVRLDELVAAYAALARGGEWIRPTWRRAAGNDHAGPRDVRRLVSPLAAYWVSDILADPEAREYVFGRGGSLELPFTAAVKTGTSQAYHDNWTVGYTRDLTVGVWVGNFDRRPLRSSTGVTGAGPIFHAVMLAAARRTRASEQAPDDRPIVARPDGLRSHEICALSGMQANEWCPSRRREWLPGGDDPPCSWHHLSDDGVLVIWPAEYREWARQHRLLREGSVSLAADSSGASLTPVSSASVRSGPGGRYGSGSSAKSAGATAAGPWLPPSDRRTTPALQIASPPNGATFLIDPTLRREFQALPLRVTTASPGPIEWLVNGHALGSASSESPIAWPLEPGTHTITARDRHGRTADSRIVVR